MLFARYITSGIFILTSLFADPVTAFGSRRNTALYRKLKWDRAKYDEYKTTIEAEILPQIKQVTQWYLHRQRRRETEIIRAEHLSPEAFIQNQHQFRELYMKLLEYVELAKEQRKAYNRLFRQNFGDRDDYFIDKFSGNEEGTTPQLDKSFRLARDIKHQMTHWLLVQKIEIEELAPFATQAIDTSLWISDESFVREIRTMRAEGKDGRRNGNKSSLSRV